MLRKMLRSMFDDARRGEDRTRPQKASLSTSFAETPTLSGPDSSKPPVLRRRSIRTLCVLALCGIVYGTMVPFHVDPSRTLHWDLPWTPFQPGDGFCNVLIYVPVGLLLRLMVRRRGTWAIVEWGFSFGVAAALSYGTEVSQTLLAGRVATLTDVLLNSLGAVVGILAAPLMQRMLRNHHAWLYDELRARPFSATAAVISLGLVIAALMPFDFQPTPLHLRQTVAHARASLATRPWHQSGGPRESVQPSAPFPPFEQAVSVQPAWALRKVLAAAAYGVLAVLLAFAAVELGRPARSAVLYATGRTMVLAGVIELLQALTVSHQADPWDLLAGWCWTLVGGAIAASLLHRWKSCLPNPAALLRIIVLGGVITIFLPHALNGQTHASALAAPTAVSWLPMAAAFNRPWIALMGDYIGSLLQYALIGAIFSLWLRTHGRVPAFAMLAAALLWFPFLGASVAVLMARSYDTMQFILAIIAAAAIVAADRSIFGTVTRDQAAL